MPIELYDRDDHCCILYTDLVDAGNEAVQANQCLIIDSRHGMLLDPGGQMTYNELYLAIGRHFPPKELEYVFASHADPDIVASLQRWLSASDTKLLISGLWARFVPHFCTSGKTEGRIVSVPDRGGRVRLGRHDLWILPAHFLHAEGNFQVYDPVSRILFSGDLGASMLPAGHAGQMVTDLAAHLPSMVGFHRRYMVSRKACALWARMVRGMPIDMIVPQHGAPIRGAKAVADFIDWIEQLECGIDLMDESNYRPPAADWRLDLPAAAAPWADVAARRT